MNVQVRERSRQQPQLHVLDGGTSWERTLGTVMVGDVAVVATAVKSQSRTLLDVMLGSRRYEVRVEAYLTGVRLRNAARKAVAVAKVPSVQRAAAMRGGVQLPNFAVSYTSLRQTGG